MAIAGNRAPLDLNQLKSKSVRFCWVFMFTRPQFRTADMGEQGAILDRIAELVEAGKLRTTLRQTLTPINAGNLRLAHTALESGRTIGKITLAGWA